MMDWTDRHCRYFHRLMTRRACLYSEMVTARAVLFGDKARLLDYDTFEHPVALQLGGAEPEELAQAARAVRGWGYDEINLNIGCPSERVQSGTFGAILMKTPDLAARCVEALCAHSQVPVSVKCRIGVDEQIPEEILPAFIEKLASAGAAGFIIHARKAWLQGLSPKENREIPPLDHALVIEMKRAFPHLPIAINGGVNSLEQVRALLAEGLDGVMIGRAAYHDPGAVLIGADALWGDAHCPDPVEVALAMRPYISAHLARGGRLHQITRHMLGLFAGRKGARHWRRLLSTEATRPGADARLIERALEQIA